MIDRDQYEARVAVIKEVYVHQWDDFYRRLVSFALAVMQHRDRGTVYAFGNGGSAAQADHFVGELLGRFKRERDPIPAQCLSNESAALTATENDYGRATYPERIVKIMRPEDSLLLLSTSGLSQNIVNSMLASAHTEEGPETLLICGRKFEKGLDPKGFPSRVQVCMIPDDDVARVQEVTLMLIHDLCNEIDKLCSRQLVEKD